MPELERQAVEQKVREILADALNLEELPRLEDRLIEDLGAESVDMLALLFELEDGFGRSVSDEEASKLTTVASIVDLIQAEERAEPTSA